MYPDLTVSNQKHDCVKPKMSPDAPLSTTQYSSGIPALPEIPKVVHLSANLHRVASPVISMLPERTYPDLHVSHNGPKKSLYKGKNDHGRARTCNLSVNSRLLALRADQLCHAIPLALCARSDSPNSFYNIWSQSNLKLQAS